MELLNQRIIESELNPNIKNKISLEILSQVDSTNSYLLNKSYEKLRPHVVLVCATEEQTKGRGRQDKEWYSPYGQNIYCSFAWQLSASHRDLSQLSLAVAVIILNVFQRSAIKQQLQLKWPNDIFYDHKKVGGILIETKRSQNGPCVLVIGIGLNINLPMGNPVAAKASDLQTISGVHIKRNKLLGVLIDEMLHKVPLYFASGFEAFINDWRSNDMLQNKFVVIKQEKHEIPGIALGINDQGELILRDAQSRLHSFRCGDVSVSM